MVSNQLFLFGGEQAWDAAEWTDSDDRVRGGKSQSYLKCSSDKPIAEFHGILDITALGGAGFASQRTIGENQSWDLSAYDGIQLDIKGGDTKLYTFNIKDELLPKDAETGREQSTISYEYHFRVAAETGLSTSKQFFVPWTALKATYRGKEKKDAPELDTKNIKRFSIMMRSFFAEQEGPFSLRIRSISAVSMPEEANQIDLESDAAVSANHQMNEFGKGLLHQNQVSRRLDDSRSSGFRFGSRTMIMSAGAAMLLLIYLLKSGKSGKS